MSSVTTPSVSYTHLDVYKRQSLDRVEICLAAYSLKQMKKSGRVSAAAAVVGDLLGIRPIISLNAVSYTHLDVYKRQIILRGCFCPARC